MVIAVTVAMLSAVAVLKPEQFMNMPKGYISVSRLGGEPLFKEENLLSFKVNGDDDFYINTFKEASLRFVEPNGTLSSVGFDGRIDLVDHVSKKDLVFGRLPETNNEIMVTKVIADIIIEGSLFQGAAGQQIGIWSYDHLTKEIVRIHDKDIKIVGIVKAELPLVYMSKELANLYTSLKASTPTLPYSYFTDTLIAGAAPLKDEVIVTEVLYQSLYGNNNLWRKLS